jgi:hypothetical protein
VADLKVTNVSSKKVVGFKFSENNRPNISGADAVTVHKPSDMNIAEVYAGLGVNKINYTGQDATTAQFQTMAVKYLNQADSVNTVKNKQKAKAFEGF